MDKEKKNLLVFGYGLTVILCFIAVRLGLKHNWPVSSMVLFAAAVFFCTITLFNRKLLKAVYLRWMAVAQVIGRIVTTLILSILFYIVFGVVGMILRLMRKDLLDRAINLQRKSYWRKRAPVEFHKENYLRQF